MSGFFFHKLFDSPPVYVIGAGAQFQESLSHVRALAGGRRCLVLARAMWHAPALAEDLRRAVEGLAGEQSGVELTVLANTEADRRHLERSGVNAIHVSSGALVDERLYYPEPGTRKLFRAVHNAQTRDFKRHELAFAIRNLALITYSETKNDAEVAELVSRYRGLAWVNYDRSFGARRLGPAGVRKLVSSSRCGLILSTVEGANFASVEYLLCGVPVVSTPSLGGREELFDFRHVIMVDPSPEAVEAAVAAYEEHAPDPFEIRRAVLEKMSVHRWRLVDWLSDQLQTDLRSLADATGWLPQYKDKLRSWITPGQV